MNESPGVIDLEIVAPEQSVVRMEAREVIVPGSEGLFTVFPGHTPFFSLLSVGAVTAVDPKGLEHFFAVTEGFVEVLEDHVVVLSFTVEHEAEIDIDRAEAAKARAQRRLRQRQEDIDFARAEAAFERALARIRVHSRDHY